MKLQASKRRGAMKGKIFAVILLACIFLSSSVNASPIIDVNNQRILSSCFYRFAVKIIDSITPDDDDVTINIVGGDADDYANGRTRENARDDLINDAGRNDREK
ncbi:MAG: hypothetical protein ACQERI_00425 [Candidatus Krumholzibacteriota bacterium]